MIGMLVPVDMDVSAFIASGINFDRKQEFSIGDAMNDLW